MRRVNTCVKSRLKSNSSCGLLSATMLGLCLAALPIISNLRAADFTINNGVTVTTQGLINGETGTIQEGGTISDAIPAIIGTGAGTITVDNSGNIISTGSFGIFTDDALVLFNRDSGNIDGAIDGVYADGAIGNLINSGSIIGVVDGVDGLIIVNLENSGTIEGGDDGVYSDSDIISLTNSGTITGLGLDTSIPLPPPAPPLIPYAGVFAFNDIIDLTNSGTITGTDSGVFAFGNIENLTNSKSGSIVGGIAGIDANAIINLENSGLIEGGEVGIGAGIIIGLENSGLIESKTGAGIFSLSNIVRLTNSGTIIGAGLQDGVHADNDILFLNNSGTITGNDDGVDANRDIVKLINTGTIIAVLDDAVDADRSIIELINSGTIKGFQNGVDAAVNIRILTNSGTITGGDNGVDAVGNIQNLINSGTINGNQNGVIALDTITSLTNSGYIFGGSNSGVRGGKNIVSLANTGSIISLVYGVSAGDGLVTDGIFSLTNAGVITGGDKAIFSAGGVDTHLTLNPGSDIYGGLDLGTGTNTLTVGKGLSIDHVFATLPQIINPNGQPLFIDGTRVVVIDSTIFDQQDQVLFDLTQGIFNTVFNHIGDGRNPASNFANGPAPQFSLGAVAPTETALGYDKSHAWASVFGSHRTIDQDSTIPSRRHNLGGLIIGADGKVATGTRLGAFFGTARTDIDTATSQQEIEIESIFGGLYASLKAENINIDLAVIGGITEQDGTRIVDNNRVNGLQIVKSDIDGTFIAPELAISTQTDIGGTIFQPTLRVGYAGLFLDGTTETGSTAPITIGDRDLHLIHARLELAAIMTSKGEDSLNFQFSPYVGIEGRSLIDGEAQDITVLGQSFNFNPGGDEDIGSAFAGLRISVLQTKTFGIFAGLEGSVDTESSTLLTANAGLKWRF